MVEYILNEGNIGNGHRFKPIKYRLDSGCWICTSHYLNNQNGYIYLYRNQEKISAHRYVYKMVNNTEIPSDMVVMHTCDNRNCINPKHLLLGTPKDNSIDMVSKGRNRAFHGKKHSNETKKLIAEKNRQREYTNRTESQKTLMSMSQRKRSGITLELAYQIKRKLLEDTGEKWLKKYQRISLETGVSPKNVQKIKNGDHFISEEIGSYKEWVK